MTTCKFHHVAVATFGGARNISSAASCAAAGGARITYEQAVAMMSSPPSLVINTLEGGFTITSSKPTYANIVKTVTSEPI
jgi:hypothetical protein